MTQKSILRFNTVNGKYCCNRIINQGGYIMATKCFNTVSGKHCCNAMDEETAQLAVEFQYRKW